MIELFIDNIKADIREDIDISLTYTQNDLYEPQAVKSAYSKTVSLEGTPTNNIIFSHIYKLDKDIYDDKEKLVGLNFNPNKRVPVYIVLNGEILDSGYFKLDDIICNNNHIQYDITLYLGFGDFFYNLMYDENEEDKTLASLYYGFDSMSKEDEDTKNLFEYNKDFVLDCWERRTTNNLDNSLTSAFCPIPLHGGLYSDFASDTVLTTNDDVPTEITEDGKTYSRTNEYAKVTLPRELSEYEIGDLRSHYQRLGIRIQSIYDAIKKPINNGGYEVDDTLLDSHSKEYIAKGYLVLNRFDYDTINQTARSIDVVLSKNPIEPKLNEPSIAVSQEIDVSDFVNPHITVSIVPEIKCISNETGDTCATLFGTDARLRSDEVVKNEYEGSEYISWFSWNGTLACGSWQIYYVRMIDENGNSQITQPIVVGSYLNSNIVGSDERLRNEIERRLKEQANNYFNQYSYSADNFNYNYYYNNSKQIQYTLNSDISADYGKEFVMPENITIQSPLSKTIKTITVEAITVSTKFVYNPRFTLGWTNATDNYGWHGGTPQPRPLFTEFGDWEYIQSNDWETVAYLGNRTVVDYNAYGYVNKIAENPTQIYDGVIATTSKRHVLNKQQIFAETKTPFDYLISLGKTFNWVFEKDVATKLIRIYSKEKYYDRTIRDISNDIDRNEYNIIPTTLEYNRYLFNINVPETYQSELFKKKNNRIYSQFIYKPNYQFSNESKEILEDSVLTLGVPYMMHSTYFTPTDKSTYMLGNKYTVTLWNDDSSIDKSYKGLMITEPDFAINSNDSVERICSFDKDNNESTELTDLIVLFNGVEYISIDDDYDILNPPIYEKIDDINFVVSNRKLWLSDDMPISETLCDNNAYVLTDGKPVITRINSTQKEIVQKRINRMPMFSNNTDSGYSILFNETNGDIDLWNLFFKNDYPQLYSKDSKIINVKMKIKEQPYKMLRRFYIIDNALFILNEINDYKPNSEDFTECQFIKIKDIEYCQM